MGKEGLLQIGEVAKLSHISVGSLRHYEKLGLLTPEYVDESSGYRYYSIRQFECLNTIRYLRVLGMSLPEIAGFTQNRNQEKIQEMLCQQKAEVSRRQEELRRVERKIDNRLQQIHDAMSAEKNKITLKKQPPRRIAWLRTDLSIESYQDLKFEASIRQLEQQQDEAVVFLGKVGVGIPKEWLDSGRYDRYGMVFLILDEEDKYAGDVEELPSETCATICFQGGHMDASAYYERLCGYIEEQGWRINGFSKEVTLIDFGFTNDPGQFVTEIQIPVDGQTADANFT